MRTFDVNILLLMCDPVREGYEDSITSLVDMTRKIVTWSVQGDALAIAQRTNLLMKIRVSVK